MKCPACGFDSPDDAGWCDFCKEPFRKRGVPGGQAAGRDAPGALALFAHLDSGERIPVVAPWVRWAAWAFLTLWFFWAFVLLGYYLGKQRLAQESAPAALPAGVQQIR